MTYYDAEIEYLENNSKSYIDLDYICTKNTSIEIKFQYSTIKAQSYLFANSLTWNCPFSMYINGISKIAYGATKTHYYKNTQITPDKNIHIAKLDSCSSAGNFYYDSRSFSFASGDRVNEPIRLFAGPDAYGPGLAKIYYIKLFENGILTEDLIPVRIGSVGYMYDKVSDRLFGNAGTGSFTLGPDVAGLPRMEGTPKVSLLRRKLLQFMPKYKPDYLCFTAIDKGTFTLSIPAALTTSNLSYVEYSVDDCNTWVKTNNVTDTAVTITTPEIISGKKVYWRGSGIRTSNVNSSSATYCATFSSTGKYNVSGTLLSLLKGREITTSTTLSYNYTFSGLFRNDTHVVSAENLIFPTNTATYCYDYFFRGCTSLVTAPKILPAMTLSSYCYRNMFYGCTSLLRGPELPALTLVGQCYNNMFYGCTKLNYIKMLATNISAT